MKHGWKKQVAVTWLCMALLLGGVVLVLLHAWLPHFPAWLIKLAMGAAVVLLLFDVLFLLQEVDTLINGDECPKTPERRCGRKRRG